MKVSIFTPTHNPRFLLQAYESIKDQPFFEWIILHNNGSKKVRIEDKRVKQIFTTVPGGVGLYKHMACNKCKGDILLELDHDDLLMPTAIEEIQKAFTKEEIGFVYSNTVRIDMQWRDQPRFDAAHNWQYRDVEINGYKLSEVINFEPTPSSVSKIWYAPDHLRAFRKSVYDKIGGHDQSLFILDDLDIMCRMYLETKFHHIDKPLYVYRVHGQNEWLKHNKAIQDGVWPIYNKYIEKMAFKWATDKGLGKLDLGGGINSAKGYTTIDKVGADINCDLNDGIPVDNNSVGIIRAYDILEHLKRPVEIMIEIQRVLAPGGIAFIQVPSTDGRGAFQDPTHISFWNENSFLYYTHKDWAKYIGTPVKFQPLWLSTTGLDKDKVCWVSAHLMKPYDGMPGLFNF